MNFAISEISQFLRFRHTLTNHRIGFVPTMGALHAGHLDLVRRSTNENDDTVVSIYVNPIQFGPGEDFQRYPRVIEKDLRLLSQFKCNVFMPQESEINEGLADFALYPIQMSQILEGKSRPGHFEGVCKIVLKLFNIVRPTNAYFGEKDFQQLTIIQHMAKTFSLPISIIACETIRDSDGMALSSRNQYLSSAERTIAANIYQILTDIAQQHQQFPTYSGTELIQYGQYRFSQIAGINVDYLTIVDTQTLLPISGNIAQSSRLLFAGYVGNTRLIDNISL